MSITEHQNLNLNIALFLVIASSAVMFASKYINRYFSKAGGLRLDPEHFTPFRILQKTQVSHDTIKLRLSLGHPDQPFNLPIGHHVAVRGYIADQAIVRPYTPVSSPRQKGYFELVVKVYKPTERFPKGGLLTQQLAKLDEGQFVEIKGPSGKVLIQHNPTCTTSPHGIQIHAIKGVYCFGLNILAAPVESSTAKVMNFIAGGSGITPIYQIMKSNLEHLVDLKTLADKGDQSALSKMNAFPKHSLIFANNTVSDILIRDELDALEREANAIVPGVYSIAYTLNSLTESEKEAWKGHLGFISKEMLEKVLHSDDPAHSYNFLCGPKGQVESAFALLSELGHQKEHILSF